MAGTCTESLTTFASFTLYARTTPRSGGQRALCESQFSGDRALNSGGLGSAASVGPAKPSCLPTFVYTFAEVWRWGAGTDGHPYQLSRLVDPHTEFFYASAGIHSGASLYKTVFSDTFHWCAVVCMHMVYGTGEVTALPKVRVQHPHRHGSLCPVSAV